MIYTSFEGFDGNPRKKETWLMLKQAFEERGVDIARPEKYSIVQERMFKQMKDGIDNLPKYKWQDGDIVEATHNDNADYEFRKIPHGSALGKEQKLEYFANACKKELCERTITKNERIKIFFLMQRTILHMKENLLMSQELISILITTARHTICMLYGTTHTATTYINGLRS